MHSFIHYLIGPAAKHDVVCTAPPVVLPAACNHKLCQKRLREMSEDFPTHGFNILCYRPILANFLSRYCHTSVYGVDLIGYNRCIYTEIIPHYAMSNVPVTSLPY